MTRGTDEQLLSSWTRAIQRELSVVRLGDQLPVFSTVTALLGQAFPENVPMSYSMQRGERDVEIRWEYSSNRRASADEMRGLLRTGRWFFAYDPLRPARWQQNRVLGVKELAADKALPEEAFCEHVRWMVARVFEPYALRTQPRVLLCHQGTMLAWLGMHSLERDDRRARRLLSAIAGAARRRLVFDDHFEETRRHWQALPQLLESLVVPAVIVDRRGRVVLANTLVPSHQHAREEWLATIKGLRTSWVGRCLQEGESAWWLLTRPARSVQLPASFDALTVRQREVLEQVVTGASSRSIGARLRISHRTVEEHIKAVLEKTGFASRARLVAWLRREP